MTMKYLQTLAHSGLPLETCDPEEVNAVRILHTVGLVHADITATPCTGQRARVTAITEEGAQMLARSARPAIG